ncbi:MAG: lysophospholipid acyltransferase family protein [Gemmatimonadota bacterium]
MRHGLRYRLAQIAGGAVLDALLGTARFDVEREDAYRSYWAQGRPVIFVLWHGRLLPLAYLHRGQRVYGLVSLSADGEYIARVLQHWDMTMVRGSSSRGGDTAFREMVRVVRAGHSMSITPDGPRGPLQQIKPGVLQLAQLTGAPLIPVAAAATRAWWFESWDRFLVPKPFARIAVSYGEPMLVPRTADPSTMASLQTRLQHSMDELMAAVERRAA